MILEVMVLLPPQRWVCACPCLSLLCIMALEGRRLVVGLELPSKSRNDEWTCSYRVSSLGTGVFRLKARKPGPWALK